MGGVKLYDLNMTEIKHRGVKWFEFIPEPPSTEKTVDKVYNGEIPLGETRNSRIIAAKFWLTGYDALDYKLLRDEVYAFFSTFKDFYAVDADLPGKRWKVKVESLNINRINRRTGEAEVTFKAHRGIAESIAFSTDDYTTADENWTTGMGIQGDVNKQDYIHSENIFKIYNAGNVVVDPRESELTITVKAVNGGTGGVGIRNASTGEEWKYTGPLNANDFIIINRMDSKRNSANIVGLTNLNLISLKPGDNNIIVTGLNPGFEIVFKFRFLYE